ncbi:MAG: hypothetical protein ACM31O_03720 [Bacteroidota bacterium]
MAKSNDGRDDWRKTLEVGMERDRRAAERTTVAVLHPPALGITPQRGFDDDDDDEGQAPQKDNRSELRKAAVNVMATAAWGGAFLGVPIPGKPRIGAPLSVGIGAAGGAVVGLAREGYSLATTGRATTPSTLPDMRDNMQNAFEKGYDIAKVATVGRFGVDILTGAKYPGLGARLFSAVKTGAAIGGASIVANAIYDSIQRADRKYAEVSLGRSASDMTQAGNAPARQLSGGVLMASKSNDGRDDWRKTLESAMDRDNRSETRKATVRYVGRAVQGALYGGVLAGPIGAGIGAASMVGYELGMGRGEIPTPPSLSDSLSRLRLATATGAAIGLGVTAVGSAIEGARTGRAARALQLARTAAVPATAIGAVGGAGIAAASILADHAPSTIDAADRALANADLDRAMQRARNFAARVEADAKRAILLSAIPDDGSIANKAARAYANINPNSAFDMATRGIAAAIKRRVTGEQPSFVDRVIADQVDRAAVEAVQRPLRAASEGVNAAKRTAADALDSGSRAIDNAARTAKEAAANSARSVREAARAAKDKLISVIAPAVPKLEETVPSPEQKREQRNEVNYLAPGRYPTFYAELNRRRDNPNDAAAAAFDTYSQSTEMSNYHPRAADYSAPMVQALGEVMTRRAELRSGGGASPSRDAGAVEGSALDGAARRKAEQKDAMLRKNDARVRGDTDARRAAAERVREAMRSGDNDLAAALEEQSDGTVQQHYRTSSTGKRYVVHEYKRKLPRA